MRFYIFPILAVFLLAGACTSRLDVSELKFGKSDFFDNSKIQSVYLMWETPDTAHTMAVQYVTTQKAELPELFYGVKDEKNKESFPFKARGEEVRITGTPIYIYRFSLTDLKSDKPYYFQVGDKVNGYTKTMSFQTIAETAEEIEWVQGGDTYPDPRVKTIGQNAVTKNTQAILIGGDITYANGQLDQYSRWLYWLNLMNDVMVTKDGRVIPLVVAIGNHEMRRVRESLELTAPFYARFFPQNKQKTYFSRNFGKETVLYVLDSGHYAIHGGDQKKWLAKSLEETKNKKHKLTMYHIPLYPTNRSMEASMSREGRAQWLPLFDKYGIDLSFENHDHNLKRTEKLYNNKIAKDNKGTVYVGDGSWGVLARSAHKRWYHKLVGEKNHVWRVRVSEKSISAEAIGEEGSTLDHFTLEASGQ
jgi:acid phosphatase type 7